MVGAGRRARCRNLCPRGAIPLPSVPEELQTILAAKEDRPAADGVVRHGMRVPRRRTSGQGLEGLQEVVWVTRDGYGSETEGGGTPSPRSVAIRSEQSRHHLGLLSLAGNGATG